MSKKGRGGDGGGGGGPKDPPERPVVDEGTGRLCDRNGDPVCYWNDQLLRAAFADSRKRQVEQEQGGPTRTSRAAAIVHAAIHDAVNGVDPVYEPYLVRERAPVSEPGPGNPPPIPPTNPTRPTARAAVGGAAYATLCWLYPSRVVDLTAAFLAYFGGAPPARDPGLAYGVAVAGAYLRARADDGSQRFDVLNPGTPRDPDENPAEPPYRRRKAPGEWFSDPLDVNPSGAPTGLQLPVGPGWGTVRPFTFGGGALFRPGPYPFPTTDAYVEGYEDVRTRGDVNQSTDATRDEAFFWSYDDGLGTPIRLYNRNVWEVLAVNPVPVGGPVTQLHAHARLFALANLAMADAGIVTWDAKYVYNHWRPVEGIRRADEYNALYGTALVRDADYRPLGRPRNRPMGERPRFNTTPPFPAYTSGHSGFGRALFDILKLVLGPAPTRFFLSTEEGDVFQGDPATGVTVRPIPRPIDDRPFNDFDEPAVENGRSRILLGVHWTFDDTFGQALGTTIAAHVFNNFLRRLGRN